MGEYARETLPHKWPWSGRQYADAAAGNAERTSQAVGDVVDQATQEVPMAAVADDLYDAALERRIQATVDLARDIEVLF